MAQFQYRAADPQGKIVEGTIEAAEQAAVVARLQDRGLLPIRIGPLDGARPARGAGRGAAAKGAGKAAAKTASRVSLPKLGGVTVGRKRVSNRQLLTTTQQLAVLVGGGLPLDRSLATLAELADNLELKRVIGEVLHAVQGGKSLAEALGQHPRVFPPLYVNMVRAGELGGFLEPTLQRLAEYLERAQQLRDEVRSALAYPIFLVFAMGGVMVLMLTYVLPRFEQLFADTGKALPLAAQVVMGASAFLRAYGLYILVALGGLAYAFRRSLQTPAGRYRWDSQKLRLPMLGMVFRKLEVASLTRTLGTLLKSGVPMLQALGILKEIAGNVVIGKAINEVEVGVREGAGIANPIARSGVFPPLAVQMMAVGEETGRLDDMLIKVAEHYDREVSVQVNQAVRLLEPVLIVVMGLAVGFVVVSMLSAIFSVNEIL